MVCALTVNAPVEHDQKLDHALLADRGRPDSLAICPELRRNYLRLTLRRGINSGVAKVAVAGKLAVRLYGTLREAAQPLKLGGLPVTIR